MLKGNPSKKKTKDHHWVGCSLASKEPPAQVHPGPPAPVRHGVPGRGTSGVATYGYDSQWGTLWWTGFMSTNHFRGGSLSTKSQPYALLLRFAGCELHVSKLEHPPKLIGESCCVFS